MLQLLWINLKFTSKIFTKSPKEILPEMRIDLMFCILKANSDWRIAELDSINIKTD